MYPIIKTEEGTFWSIGDMKFEVFKEKEGVYIIPQLETEFSFEKNGAVQFFKKGNPTSGTKIRHATITVEDKADAGKYIGTEFDAVHDVVFTEDALILRNNKTGEMPFKKYDNGIYLDTDTSMVAIRFEKDKMYISSHRAVNVELIKIGKELYGYRKLFKSSCAVSAEQAGSGF